MAVTTHITRWVDVPHEPGERFLFKMPSWVEIEEAKQERQRNALLTSRATREAAGPEILAEWKAQAKEDREQAEAKAAAEAGGEETTALVKPKTTAEVLAEFDKFTVLRYAVRAWTYCEPQRDADGNPLFDDRGNVVPDRSLPIAVTDAALRALDPVTQDWAALTAIALRESGFRPVMPELVETDDGDVIEVRPGTDERPFARSSTSADTLTASPV